MNKIFTILQIDMMSGGLIFRFTITFTAVIRSIDLNISLL